MKWEEISMIRGKKEIEKENQEWIKGHFTHFHKTFREKEVYGEKDNINIKETIQAIEKMGKNKASSVDELMDIIFQEKEWRNLEKRLKEKE